MPTFKVQVDLYIIADEAEDAADAAFSMLDAAVSYDTIDGTHMLSMYTVHKNITESEEPFEGDE